MARMTFRKLRPPPPQLLDRDDLFQCPSMKLYPGTHIVFMKDGPIYRYIGADPAHVTERIIFRPVLGGDDISQLRGLWVLTTRMELTRTKMAFWRAGYTAGT